MYQVSELTTDRHISIDAYVKREWKDVEHFSILSLDQYSIPVWKYTCKTLFASCKCQHESNPERKT